MSLVTKAVDAVQTDHYHELEQFEQKMKARSIIQEELLEAGSFTVEAIAEKIFEDVPECKIAFQEKMEKYDLVKEEIAPISESTIRKYHKKKIITDTGIEIKIPMEQYRDTKYVEFITNPDGTTSVVIKNISLITAKL